MTQSSSDPYLSVLARAESGGNANAKNPNSSATGLYQFTKGTWSDLVDKYGKQYGITQDDINDPRAQSTMASLFTRDNANGLAPVLGHAPTNGDLYAAHFLGLDGAKKLLTSDPSLPAAALFPDAAHSNHSIFYADDRPRTVSEVRGALASKVS